MSYTPDKHGWRDDIVGREGVGGGRQGVKDMRYKYLYVYVHSGLRLKVSTTSMLQQGQIECNCCIAESCVLDIMIQATIFVSNVTV